ncbi:TlpA family protein disulfide reductase [Mucilaginibacter psychrotolerans]|uniref:TlpA family protein disulfide reductase n=1 Tax=Mucilaginibacter psychrotolerans TaxID=1524096 RepID=UPI00130547E0|nr:TlpA disulfide reductase family protein [Mucilaginibacter psychrotolerans]
MKRTVTIYPRIAPGEKIYVIRKPFGDEREITVDSAVIKESMAGVVLKLHSNEDRLYDITSTFNNYTVSIISDTTNTIVNVDYFKRSSDVSNSPATVSLLAFNSRQAYIARDITKCGHSLDSAYRANALDTLVSLKQKRMSLLYKYTMNSISYADTVKSGAAFMVAYNSVDFGKDYGKLHSFMQKAHRRFGHYRPFMALESKVQKYINIMTVEYNVGDVLPGLVLPDTLQKPLSTTDLCKGKVCLINLWSTWCPQCYPFIEQQRKAQALFSPAKFQMISVALDPDVNDWKAYVSVNKLYWHQVIDKDVWTGTSVYTFKADSIPYNFLLAPDGKIVAKGISPDSLIHTLKRYLK